MSAEALFDRHAPRLTRRLERMVGSREVAEELSQEAFLRYWRSAPDDLSPEQGAAWLQRTASNLAVDELRRRRLREVDSLEEGDAAAIAGDEAEALSVREALDRISAHERLLVLLRFQVGLSHAEIGELLAISAEAARKRASRARRAFAAAFHGTRDRDRPVILMQIHDDPSPYVSWLERAGAEVRLVRPGPVEPQIALADGFVLAGSVTDIDPALYREPPRVRLNTPSLNRDVRELGILRAALTANTPFVGVCRGSQLLNIALGGNLYQDIGRDGATGRSHWGTRHQVETAPGTDARRLLGRSAVISSEHHQAVRRLGRGLRRTSSSEDSITESVELAGTRLALGLQWHPEHQESTVAGERVAAALMEAAEDRR
jgi:putative glutamine amidotransferase